MKNIHSYDLIILGGGPAGMTAAIYAARANVRTIVLESNITGGLVNSTHTVENFPSWPSIHGMELMEKMRQQVDALDVPVEEVCEVEALELQGDIKRVFTEDAVYEAKAIILATGRQPIALETPTLAQEVHHCAICDGAPYVNKRVLVVGGGNSAFDESLYLLNLGVAHITIIESMDRFFAAQATQGHVIATGKVTALLRTKVADICLDSEDKLCGIILENIDSSTRHTIPADGIFVFLGQKPNNALFAGQVALSKGGYILAGSDMGTNIPGVYGAGDINEKTFRQITTAVADGTIAALAAERYIRTQQNRD